MGKTFGLWFACAVLFSGATAAQAPAEFRYRDLEAFARAHAAIRDGADAETTIRAYVAQGSPTLRAFMQRYELTDDAMVQALVRSLARRPKYYAYIGALQPRLEADRPAISQALGRLLAMAPPEAAAGGLAPIDFMVANSYAGATPVTISASAEASASRAVAVALETMAMGPEVDMTEFPNGPAGRAALTDIPQVVVHETAHILQSRAQGMDNYTSIYRGSGDNLAIAIREGCADYVTWLASGWQLGQRHVYGQAHEAELWAEFRQVMDAPAFSTPGWFDGGDPAKPERPSQIGYWLGMSICRTYHEQAADKAAALRDIFSAWRPEDFRRILAPYAARAAAP